MPFHLRRIRHKKNHTEVAGAWRGPKFVKLNFLHGIKEAAVAAARVHSAGAAWERKSQKMCLKATSWT